jgi:hypothetical protein
LRADKPTLSWHQCSVLCRIEPSHAALALFLLEGLWCHIDVFVERRYKSYLGVQGKPQLSWRWLFSTNLEWLLVDVIFDWRIWAIYPTDWRSLCLHWLTRAAWSHRNQGRGSPDRIPLGNTWSWEPSSGEGYCRYGALCPWFSPILHWSRHWQCPTLQINIVNLTFENDWPCLSLCRTQPSGSARPIEYVSIPTMMRPSPCDQTLLFTFTSSSTHGIQSELPKCKPPRIGLDTRNPQFPRLRYCALVWARDSRRVSGTLANFSIINLAIGDMSGSDW